MPIDSSIYNQQQPDFLGSFEKGMRLGDMIKQRRQEGELQDAYKAGIIQNPDGTVTQDGNKTMTALMNLGRGDKAWELQDQLNQRKQAEAKIKKEKEQSDIEHVTRAAWSVNDQNSYDTALQNLKSKGIDTSQLPPQYNPQMIDQVRRQTLTVKERLDELDKQARLKIEQDKLGIERTKAGAKSGGAEGRKALDKDFAKDYNDWTTGAAKRSRNEIQKLEGVVERLKDNKGTTGGATGMFGDRLTSNDVLKNRADVQQSAMTLIKQLLSGATSDTDRKAIVDTLWNEADSTENNIGRIERFVVDMKNRADDYDAKASFFEKNNTLGGYKAFPDSNSPKGQQNQTKFVQVVAPNGSIKNIPENMLQDALNSGGKLAPQKAGY
jgi:hypothetical protein